MARSIHTQVEQSAFSLELRSHPSSVSLVSRSELSSNEEQRSEGYDECFDPPLESKYVCPICLLGLREPVQTKCGHRFCEGCILLSMRKFGSVCPVDNEPLDESQLFPDVSAERELLSRVVCCRYGCPWKGPLRQIENHYEGCPKYPQTCERCEKQNIPRDMMEEHLDKECPKTNIKCPFNIVGCTFEVQKATGAVKYSKEFT